MQHTTQKNIIKVNISIPPETKFRGYRGITMSIYLCNRVRSISFWRWKIGSSDFTQRLLTTRRYAIILKQGLLSKFKVAGRKSAKFVSFFMEKLWKFLLYTNNCLPPEDLSWFWPKVIPQVQGHWRKVQNLCPVRLCVENDSWRYTTIAYDLRVCNDLDLRHLSRFKLTGRKSAKLVTWLYLS